MPTASTAFCCLMIFCFARAHFHHLYTNQGSMGESKPMMDVNWNIKHLRSRSPHLESYWYVCSALATRFPQWAQTPVTHGGDLVTTSLLCGNSLMKVSEIVSQIYYLKANPYVLAWFMDSPIVNSYISSNIPKGTNFRWWWNIGVRGKISKRWIYKWRFKKWS